MSDEFETSGLDRRQLLRRGAMVGGALVWATPVVQSLTPAAYAHGSPANGNGAPSYVMLVLKCGNTYSSVKITQTGAASCGVNGGNGHAQTDSKRIIDAQLPAGVTWASLIGKPCVTPTTQVTPGGLKVNHAGCSVVAWSVHDGASNGCGQTSFGPAVGDRGVPAYSPTIGAAQSIFPKPVVTTCP
jgi:hypothetical protein